MVCSSPHEWSSQTGGATAAVDAEFGGGERAEVESGLAEAGVGFRIFFDSEKAIVAKGEDIAGECVALRGIDFDEVESAGFQEFDGFDGEPGQIDERGVFIKQAD
jgi:hypothetical protein